MRDPDLERRLDELGVDWHYEVVPLDAAELPPPEDPEPEAQ